MFFWDTGLQVFFWDTGLQVFFWDTGLQVFRLGRRDTTLQVFLLSLE
ncbi:hypothetical protein GCM10009647_024890 [Streptomyces sanglieri]